MPLTDRRPISEDTQFVNDPNFSSAGHICAAMVFAPFAGKITHMGFQNLNSTSSIGSTVTIALSILNSISGGSTLVTSTAVNTSNVWPGGAAKVAVPNELIVNEGDGVQFTASGGNNAVTSNINLFCVFRPAGV